MALVTGRKSVYGSCMDRSNISPQNAIWAEITNQAGVMISIQNSFQQKSQIFINQETMLDRLIDPYTTRDERPDANLLIHKLQKAYH